MNLFLYRILLTKDLDIMKDYFVLYWLSTLGKKACRGYKGRLVEPISHFLIEMDFHMAPGSASTCFGFSLPRDDTPASRTCRSASRGVNTQKSLRPSGYDHATSFLLRRPTLLLFLFSSTLSISTTVAVSPITWARYKACIKSRLILPTLFIPF